MPKKGPKWIHSSSLKSIPFSVNCFCCCSMFRKPHHRIHRYIITSSLVIIIGFTLFTLFVWISVTHQNREGDWRYSLIACIAHLISKTCVLLFCRLNAKLVPKSKHFKFQAQKSDFYPKVLSITNGTDILQKKRNFYFFFFVFIVQLTGQITVLSLGFAIANLRNSSIIILLLYVLCWMRIIIWNWLVHLVKIQNWNGTLLENNGTHENVLLHGYMVPWVEANGHLKSARLDWAIMKWAQLGVRVKEEEEEAENKWIVIMSPWKYSMNRTIPLMMKSLLYFCLWHSFSAGIRAKIKIPVL